MKKLIFLSLMILMSAFKSDNKDIKSVSVIIMPSSQLSIIGKTNVSHFNCELNIIRIDSLIPVNYFRDGNKMTFNNTKLFVQNSCFDCGTKKMNSDFLELLKTEQHPHIILNLKEIIINASEETNFIAYVDIKVAGITKPYSVPVILNRNETLKVSGCFDLKLSDFNIEAPRKVLGLIVVSNEFQINFDLELDESN